MFIVCLVGLPCPGWNCYYSHGFRVHHFPDSISMSLFRVGANTQAMNALSSLYNVNEKMGVHQARLASGKRINSAQDDTAGYAIAQSLKSRKSGLESALSNVSNAKSISSIAEGGYQAQMNILQTIKDKVVQVQDGSLSSSQQGAIYDQITELRTELDDIKDQTKWNGSALIGASAFTFHVGADAGDTLSVTFTSFDSSGVSISGVAGTASSADITAVDTAIDTLAGHIQDVGDKMGRLSSKEDTLSVSVTNTDAVRSTYEDADFAKEQMEVMKAQILQQTAVSSFSQANAAPQIVLSLFR